MQEDMTDTRAANRHLSHADWKISRASLVLDELSDFDRESAFQNIEGSRYDCDAVAELSHAKMHIEVALEILTGEHDESKGDYPADELPRNTGGQRG